MRNGWFLIALLVPLAIAGEMAVLAAPPRVAAPPEIPADCSTDVTRALTAWIASVPDGATLLFPSGGCYRVDDSLIVADRYGLTFEGNGVTFRAVADTGTLAKRRHLWFQRGGSLTIRNLIVRGANPQAGTGRAAYVAAKETQHGIALQGVQGAVIEQVQVYDVYGDFVYLGPDLQNSSLWSRNILVRSSRFERNGRQGISVTAAEDVVIEGNVIGDVRRATFDLEPSGAGWGARRIRIVNNRTGHGRLLWLASHGAGVNVSDITIAGNVMLDETGAPLITMKAPAGSLRGPGIVIEDNQFMVRGTPGGRAMAFERLTGVTLRRNTILFKVRSPETAPMEAVTLRESTGVRVHDNRFCNATRVLSADPLSRDYQEWANQLRCP